MLVEITSKTGKNTTNFADQLMKKETVLRSPIQKYRVQNPYNIGYNFHALTHMIINEKYFVTIK